MMIHPVGMPDGKGGVAGVVPTLAIQTVNVDFYGRTSHAGAAPWDGINALDAANIAYTSISAMRQQMHPTDRIHGIIIKGGDAPNSKSLWQHLNLIISHSRPHLYAVLHPCD